MLKARLPCCVLTPVGAFDMPRTYTSGCPLGAFGKAGRRVVPAPVVVQGQQPDVRSACDCLHRLRDWVGDWVGTFLGAWRAHSHGLTLRTQGCGVERAIERRRCGACRDGQCRLFCVRFPVPADLSKVWDTYTGECLHTFSHNHIVRSVAVDAQATQLLTGGHEKKLRLFDLGKPPVDANGAQVFRTRDDDGTTHEGAIRSVVLGRGADTQHTVVTAAEEGPVQWWDLRTLSPIYQLSFLDPIASLDRCTGSFGEYVTLTTGHDAHFIDLARHEVVRQHHLEVAPSSVYLHPTKADRFVAGCTGDEWVHIHDYESGAELEVLKGHHGPVHCVSYSPDGEVAASGSEDGGYAVLQCLHRHDPAVADDAGQKIWPLVMNRQLYRTKLGCRV